MKNPESPSTHPYNQTMLADAIRRVIARQELSRGEARAALEEILAGAASPAQIAAFLTGLAMKGETSGELTGFAEAIRAAAAPWPGLDAAVDASGTGHEALAENPLVDTCGTGGDAAGTFNISTAAAIVAAGAGLRIAKHGNRSISSRCGSADVLEALGVRVDLPPEAAAACLRETGLAFLFAPRMHGAMKQVQPVRRELGFRTVFNLLGPLCNPAGARAQVVGVYAPELTTKMAEALAALGARRAFVAHGADGLDEITTTAPTRIAEVREGSVQTYSLDARELGLARASLADLAGGDAAENARIITQLLDPQLPADEKTPDGKRLRAQRDITVLNAAAALRAANGMESWPEASAHARQALESGQAQAALRRWAGFRWENSQV